MSFLGFAHLTLLSRAPTKAMQGVRRHSIYLRSNLNINVCLQTPILGIIRDFISEFLGSHQAVANNCYVFLW